MVEPFSATAIVWQLGWAETGNSTPFQYSPIHLWSHNKRNPMNLLHRRGRYTHWNAPKVILAWKGSLSLFRVFPTQNKQKKQCDMQPKYLCPRRYGRKQTVTVDLPSLRPVHVVIKPRWEFVSCVKTTKYLCLNSPPHTWTFQSGCHLNLNPIGMVKGDTTL